MLAFFIPMKILHLRKFSYPLKILIPDENFLHDVIATGISPLAQFTLHMNVQEHQP